MASKDWSLLAKEFSASRTGVPTQFEQFVASSADEISRLWRNIGENTELVEYSLQWREYIYEFWYGAVTRLTRGYSNMARHSGETFNIALFHSTICDFIDDIGLSSESAFMKKEFLKE